MAQIVSLSHYSYELNGHDIHKIYNQIIKGKNPRFYSLIEHRIYNVVQRRETTNHTNYI